MRLRVLACVVGIGAASAVVGSVPAAASACRSLAAVKSFHGHADFTFDGSASGTDASGSPSVAIDLQHQATDVDITLSLKRDNHHGVVLFIGTVSGGTVKLDDSYIHRDQGAGGTAFTGTESLTRSDQSGTAELVFVKKFCTYQFHATYLVHGAAFSVTSSDSNVPTADEVPNPGTVVGESAYGPREQTPGSLKLHGFAVSKAYRACPGAPFVTGESCYLFGGGWAGDFRTLHLCGSLDVSNCDTNGENSEGPFPGQASFHWLLKPTLRK